MKEKDLRRLAPDWLAEYKDIKEGSAKHKEILKAYNDSKICTRYKMTTGDAWCATAVSAAFIATGQAGKAGSGALFQCVECSCAMMINLAKEQGIWTENDAYTPQVGDVILYDWQDSGSGDNKGVPDHVGIVYSVSGKNFRVIEGNIHDTVGFRDMQVNGRYIRGYITPNYAAHADGVPVGDNVAADNGSAGTATLNESTKWVGRITGNGVNVRTWAGTENATCKTIGPLSKHSVVNVCDNVPAADGAIWYYINYQGRYGFVHSRYVSALETPASYENAIAGTYTTSAALNLRAGAGTTGNRYGADKTVLVTIPSGARMHCDGRYSMVDGVKWLYLSGTIDGDLREGFASSKYLKYYSRT